MMTRKTCLLAALMLTILPLRPAELVSRVADDCKCDRSTLSCKILCSGIGSGTGTGDGASSFNVAPGSERQPQERPNIVPRRDDFKGPTQSIK